MGINSTSENILRGIAFEFTETLIRETGETDIYTSSGATRIQVEYSAEGDMEGIRLCAPSMGIDHIDVYEDVNVKMDDDALEALLYELIDGERLVERMSGVMEDRELPDPV